MADIMIRPSMKFIHLGYLFAAIAGISIGAAIYATQASLYGFIAMVLLFWPLWKHARRQLTKITIAGDKLRYELGLFSKVTRTIQLSKLQDITVRQRLGQRLTGVGDLSFETAGETSRLTIVNIDKPQEIADKIMDLAQQGERTAHT